MNIEKVKKLLDDLDDLVFDIGYTASALELHAKGQEKFKQSIDELNEWGEELTHYLQDLRTELIDDKQT